jgi:hypothetical protein
MGAQEDPRRDGGDGGERLYALLPAPAEGDGEALGMLPP